MHEYPWVILNMLLHGGTVLVLPFIATLLLRDHGRRLDARLAAAVALGGLAFTLISTPGVMHVKALWHAPLMAISVANPFVFWLLSRALLTDDFALRPWHWVVWGLFAAKGVALTFMQLDPDLGAAIIALPVMALMLLTAVQAFASWREDLVEQRRRLRLAIVMGVIFFMVVSHAVVLNRYANGLSPLAGNSLYTATLLGIALYGAWRLLAVPDDLFAEASPALQPEPTELVPELPEVEQPDPRLIDALNELMQVEQVYREENLTIAALAQRMKLSEPRLRQLINKELGHRNFNAFLNTFRIEDAKRALADPRYAEVPILTISVEAGFQSLGPFNRAFKAATGMTPTDFRRAAATGELPAADPAARPAFG
ncbi:MAG: AraC family transcriptional regulator [Rhizobacter sp.]